MILHQTCAQLVRDVGHGGLETKAPLWRFRQPVAGALARAPVSKERAPVAQF